MSILHVIGFAVVLAFMLVGVIAGVWWWWLWRDTRRYREYLHRSGRATIPTPHGRLPVPSDDDLRRSLLDLDLPTEGNPNAEEEDGEA